MAKLKLFYATNRKHVGDNRWNPDSYGTDPSSDRIENLRFGKLTLEVDKAQITKHLKTNTGVGKGDGEKLAEYLSECVEKPNAIEISAFVEDIDKTLSDANQPSTTRYGSIAMFTEIQKIMRKSHDVLIFIHGFNVAWNEAVGSALALQEMLNSDAADATKRTMVVLFTWPSDGQALPFVSYKSDQEEARGSGGAVGRGFLKLRDFLIRLRRNDSELCNQEFHILCHSMGNYVLQSAVAKIARHSNGPVMPRIFDHVFMCAPDVDDNALETGNALGRLHEITHNVTVYFNTGDIAMHVSDYTKGNPDRLGTAGSARPSFVHSKIHQVDCSEIVTGFVEHSYYLAGRINKDIRQSIMSVTQYDKNRPRKKHPAASNTWIMR